MSEEQEFYEALGVQLGKSQEELHQAVAKITPEDRQVFADWIKTRPQGVQDALKGLDPHIVYRCTCDRRITGIGTIGTIEGATESGKLIFAAHVVYFGSECSDEQIKTTVEHAGKGPVKVYLDPHEVEPDPPPAEVV